MPRKAKPRVLTKQIHFFAEPRQSADLRLLARLLDVEMSYLLRRAVTELLDRHKPILAEARRSKAETLKRLGKRLGADGDPGFRRLVERAMQAMESMESPSRERKR